MNTYNGYTESKAVVEARWVAMQKRAAMVLKYEIERLHTENVLAKVRANRIAREEVNNIKATTKDILIDIMNEDDNAVVIEVPASQFRVMVLDESGEWKEGVE